MIDDGSFNTKFFAALKRTHGMANMPMLVQWWAKRQVKDPKVGIAQCTGAGGIATIFILKK